MIEPALFISLYIHNKYNNLTFISLNDNKLSAVNEINEKEGPCMVHRVIGNAKNLGKG